MGGISEPARAALEVQIAQTLVLQLAKMGLDERILNDNLLRHEVATNEEHFFFDNIPLLHVTRKHNELGEWQYDYKVPAVPHL